MKKLIAKVKGRFKKTKEVAAGIGGTALIGVITFFGIPEFTKLHTMEDQVAMLPSMREAQKKQWEMIGQQAKEIADLDKRLAIVESKMPRR